MAAKTGGLGRGLGALMREVPREQLQATHPPAPAPAPAPPPADPPRVPVARIRAGAFQPRRTFRPEPLDELVKSIRDHGVLQPLLVRASGDGYELIAGERRLRAATAAGLADVPVKIMAVTDREALELALIENLQREDLDPIEEADGYRMLGERFELTQEQIAERVGRARASVANALRLLTLAEPVRRMLEERTLSVGHAKVLLSLEIPAEQALLAEQAVREDLSVRALEKRVALLQRGPRRRRSSQPDVPENHLRDLEEKLQQRLGTAVKVFPSRTMANGKKASGAVEIQYYTADDLDRLMLILGISDEF